MNHQTVFENDVWEAFYALGMESIIIPFHESNKFYRLIPSPKINCPRLDLTKDVFDWLKHKELITQGEGKRSVNKSERSIWYEITAAGQNIYDKLSLSEDFREKFTEKYHPLRQR